MQACYIYSAGKGHCSVHLMSEPTRLLNRICPGSALPSIPDCVPAWHHAAQRWDDNELGMMEAVVTKMSRVIAHVGIGEKGKHVVQQLQVTFRACQSQRPSSHHAMPLGAQLGPGKVLAAAAFCVCLSPSRLGTTACT